MGGFMGGEEWYERRGVMGRGEERYEGVTGGYGGGGGSMRGGGELEEGGGVHADIS